MKPVTLLYFCLFLLAACTPGRAETSPPPQTLSATAPVTTPKPASLSPTSLTETSTPGAQSSQRVSPIDGMPQVYVPAGQVRMGGLDVHADEDELPAHTVALDAFWIDQLEVTNAMYLLCVQSGACSPPATWGSEQRLSYFNDETYKDYPVIQVPWEQASAYCSWAGRRLPTEAEWERAARGDDFRTFPWGDEPPSEIYANYSRLVGDTSRVGSYATGASPFGALDMAGNVWEWVADYSSNQYYATSASLNPTGPDTSTTYQRVIRGGSFQDEWIDIRVSKRGSALGPDPLAPYDDPNRNGESSSKIGFRCVAGE